jgi:hypothetical protein
VAEFLGGIRGTNSMVVAARQPCRF